jgi:hypothetical protein
MSQRGQVARIGEYLLQQAALLAEIGSPPYPLSILYALIEGTPIAPPSRNS